MPNTPTQSAERRRGAREVDKITMDILRSLPDGRATTYVLPSPVAVINAKSMAYKYAAALGCRFSCTSSTKTPNVITITRHSVNYEN